MQQRLVNDTEAESLILRVLRAAKIIPAIISWNPSSNEWRTPSFDFGDAPRPLASVQNAFTTVLGKHRQPQPHNATPS